MITTVKKLLSQISFAGKVIERKPVLDVLTCLLFHNGYVMGSNLAIYNKIKTGFPEKVSFLVEYHSLLAILKVLPKEDTLTISIGPEHVHFTSNTKSFKLSCESSDDYPKCPENFSSIGSLSKEQLLTIERLSGYTSNDQLRPAMCNVYTNGRIAATDGHILLLEPFILKLEDKETLLFPSKVAKTLSTLESAVVLKFGMFIELRDNERSIIFRECDDRYPDFNSAIPVEKDFKLSININKNDLIMALKRIASLANKATYKVVFEFMEEGKVRLSCENFDFENSYQEYLICEYGLKKEFFSIGFNARFMLHVLADSQDEIVHIKMVAPNRATVIDDKILIMPVMISNYA